jgi:hypothetical protein
MRVFSALLLLSIALVSFQRTLGQSKTQPPDDVIRTKTELVQTDLTVPAAVRVFNDSERNSAFFCGSAVLYVLRFLLPQSGRGTQSFAETKLGSRHKRCHHSILRPNAFGSPE